GLAAALLAEQRLKLANAALRDQRPERGALEAAAAAYDALERVRFQTRAVAGRLEKRFAESQPAGSSNTTESAEQASLALQMLDGADFRSLAKLATAARKGQDTF